MNQNIVREVVNPKGGEGRGTRSKKLTGKGVTWKCGVPFERWGRINGRSIRKYATIECLLFSSRKFRELFEMKRIMHSWKTKLEPRMMNELMRLTNRSFPLRVKYHAGWRILKKITTQKVNLEKTEAQHQENHKYQWHQRNQDLLDDPNHLRRSLEIKTELLSWQ